MPLISLKILKDKGFRILNQLPVIAVLQVSKNSFLCLQLEGEAWILGHSVNGKDIFFRPGGNTRYQLIKTIDEVDFEIEWLKKNNASKAIEISIALSTAIPFHHTTSR